MDIRLLGVSRENVEKLSEIKGEPEWMLEKRLRALEIFNRLEMPKWGPELNIDFSSVKLYSSIPQARTWDDIPEDIRRTLDALGLPQAEKDVLAGLTVQYDSSPVYRAAKKYLEESGVVFIPMERALEEYPEIVKKHFGRIVPPSDHKFAALNTAVWSGGSFVYVPEGTKLEMPLQAFFLINTRALGQFERTLIVAEKDSSIHYIEGCAAPVFSEDNLHAAVVEVFVGKGAKVKYTTIQNWSKNVLNLATKRALVMEKGTMEWVDGNIGSRINMKYPACILAGEGARGQLLSIAYASEGQVQDAGGKMIHLAPNTQSRIVSKAIVAEGRADYRGMVRISKSAKHSRAIVTCDTLLLGKGKSASYPVIIDEAMDADVLHEATAGKISEELLFYLMSRGLSEQEALEMIALGFVGDVMREIPLEYAMELNRLIRLKMEGAIG